MILKEFSLDEIFLEQMGNSSNPGNCFGPHLLCGDICVPFKKICDGKVDCTSGDDEGMTC